MGFDITYHPVGADEIEAIYFDGLSDQQHYQSLVSRFGVNEFYAEQLRSRFAEASSIDATVSFQKGHAFYVAIISGFLRKHHYIRGGAFSFLAGDAVMARYFGDWRALIPEAYRDAQIDNCLIENYCGGAYLPCEQLKQLRDDYQADPYVRAKMDEIFSDGRLAVFWQAVDDAVAQSLGLVEASEVVEPDPFDLNATRSLSNLFNCYPDGAILYAETAMQQLAAAQTAPQELPEADLQATTPVPPVSQTEPVRPAKKGLLARLFGR